MAGIDDGSLVGFIRGITARKRAANIEEGQRNYLTDPTAAIAQVNEVKGGGPEAAYQLQQRMKGDQANDLTTQLAGQQRYLGAVKNMAGMLAQARDGGADIGAAFDGMTPIMQKGLGMSPEEIADYKAKIVANPTLIDAIGRDADAKLMNVAAGGSVFDPNTKKEIFNNPGVSKPISIKRGDGGTDVLIYDPETRGFVQAGGAAPAGAGVPGAPGAPFKYNGPLSIDPQARGVRNGNPGNLKDGPFAKSQPGYIGTDGTFAKFAPGFGEAAQENLLRTNYLGKGVQTVDAIVDKYLGKGDSENSQASRANYKAYVAGRLGIDPSQPVPSARLRDLGQAMREFENGSGAAASGGGGVQPAYSSAGKPEAQQGRPVTPAERQIYGLDAETPYFMNPKTGKPEKIGERPMGGGARNLGKANPTQIVSFYKDVQSLQQEVNRLLASPDLDGAVGPIQSRIAGYYSKGAKQFQNDVESVGSRLVVQTLNKMKALSATGASGFGNFSNKEGDRLAEQMGSLKLDGDEAGVRRTLQNVIAWTNDQLGAMPPIGSVPNKAIQYLKTHPGSRAQFDQHYGEGMSALFLGK